MKQSMLEQMLADAGLAQLAGDRISWSERVRGTPLPAITLFRIGGTAGVVMSGSDDLDGAEVQADCWAESPEDADDLATAVKAWAKGVNTATTNGALQGVFPTAEHDFAEGEAPERIHRTVLTLRVWRPQT